MIGAIDKEKCTSSARKGGSQNIPEMSPEEKDKDTRHGKVLKLSTLSERLS